MDAREGKEKYEKAVWLYHQRRADEALAMIPSLESAFPNDRHVMYLRGLCLADAEREYEAGLVFRRLQTAFGNGPWTSFLTTSRRIT